MKKIKLLPLILAVVMMVSVPIYADAATETENIVKTVNLEIDGMKKINVTSSMARLFDKDVDLPTDFLFDGIEETKLEVSVTATDKFEVYTAFRAPEALAAFGTILSGEEGTQVKVKVYGTNDALQFDWHLLTLKEENAEKIDDYYVLEIDSESVQKYSFYKFEFKAEGCGDITISELSLLKEDNGEPDMKYEFPEEFDSENPPKLVPVEDTETEQKEQKRVRKINFLANMLRFRRSLR